MKRNAYFDNARALLIFLVVFGHMIQPFINSSAGIGTLYTWIYTFHMPAFILLAGFFAKGSGNIAYIVKLAKKLLVPYIVFQIIYTGYYLLIGKNYWLTESVFYPHWSLWFLVSLFCWNILLIVYRKFPPVIGVSVALIFGIIIGFFDNVGHMFSLSRTFVLFPFFLIGYLLSEEHIMILKRKSVKYSAVIVMIVVAITIYFLPHINTGWLLASKSYSHLGSEVYGGFARLSVYVTSSIMVACLLAWIPERKFIFTKIGERTLYVYLLHGFIVQYFRQMDLFSVDHFSDLFVIALISLMIVIVLSSKYVITIWQPLIEVSTAKLRSIFQKKEVEHKGRRA